MLFDADETTRLNGGLPARERNELAGVVFQEHNLLPSLDVLQNVTLPLRYGTDRGCRPPDRRPNHCCYEAHPTSTSEQPWFL